MTVLEQLRAVNAASPFNSWAGFALMSAAEGRAELALDPRPEALQHAGFLHAGILGAMIDTSCGFAAASIAGAVLASQYQVLCYKPAVGQRFIARARVDRAGKRQVFASADIFAITNGKEALVAAGTTILMIAA